MNQRYVLTTVKLKDLLSLFVIGLHKVQTQNLLFTFTWNVKRAQNNFVPIFNSKVGVRLVHECDLYSSKYGTFLPFKVKICLSNGFWPITGRIQGSLQNFSGMFVVTTFPAEKKTWDCL